MTFIEAPTNFYLGRLFDPISRQLEPDVLYYDSRDLVTHALVVGMTGSGKTGFCTTLLEEAILDNIPVLIIDPKGDLTNLLLNFPELRPEDFEEWVNPDDARRAGMDIKPYAVDVANNWRTGLQNWGIVPERLKWLKRIADYTIYTPGSDAGIPVSILSSLRAPHTTQNKELLNERISGITAALLGLVGIDADPVKDSEFVLLAKIFEYNWTQGLDLTLEDIILQIQNPPFDKLGVVNVEQYISEKKRYNLAMSLNNIIASPTFSTWLEGAALDIPKLLYQPNGRPRVSIFYTAHLTDDERMFVTTLILDAFNAWMRTLSGTSSLRALLYMDEIYGLFPPYPKNPPSKVPLMRLLKQARAFGIGLILATQNPGDLDYKGMGNMGTWFIGRLQSENDRKRVMAGLQELANTDEQLNIQDVESLVADLPPRVFLMRNVHNHGGPIMFHSRWAMSYLRGPLTRQQIRKLMADKRAQFQSQNLQVQSANNQPASFQRLAQGRPLPPELNVSPPADYSQTQFGVGAYATPPSPGQSYSEQSAPAVPPAPQPAPPQPQQPGMPAVQQPPNPLSNPFSIQGPSNIQIQSSPTPKQGNAPQGYNHEPPPLAPTIPQYFLPATLTQQQAIQAWVQSTNQHIQQMGQAIIAYQPVLLAQVTIRYIQRTAQLFTNRSYAFHIPNVEYQGIIDWEANLAPIVDKNAVATQPTTQAYYGDLPAGLTDSKYMTQLKRDLTDTLYHKAQLIVPFHPQFKIYGDPDKPMDEFQSTVYQLAREKRDDEIDKTTQKFGSKMDTLENKVRRKEQELEMERAEIKGREREQRFTTGEAVISLMKGRTNYTLSRMSRTSRMTDQTEVDIKETHQTIDRMVQEMEALKKEYERTVASIDDKWAKIANDFQEYTITPNKKDIYTDLFGVGWLPMWYTSVNGYPLMLKAFG